MLTITIRHHKGERLVDLRKGLMRAYRKLRQQGTIQRIFKRRVTASIRAFETTHSSANGWHPHLHLLLRTSEWTRDEREQLVDTWRRIVVEELGGDHVPDIDHGMVWSPAIRTDGQAAYVAKLGLEVVWNDKPTRAKTSRNPWEIARDAADGDKESIALWREYEAATKGLRALELDDRAAKWARGDAESPMPLDVAHECEPIDDHTASEPIVLDISNDELATIRRAEKELPAALYLTLRVVEANPTREALDQWIYELAKIAPPRLRAPPLVGAFFFRPCKNEEPPLVSPK